MIKISATYIHTALLAVTVAGFSPVLSYAYALDSKLDCKSSAHAFIAPLVKNRYIDPSPMRVEANSINAFRPVQDSNLTAFGYRVSAVFGYEHDDALFKRADAEPIGNSAYGTVVFGSAESVEASARRAGSGAVIHQVVPLLLTAIFCNGT